MGRDTFLSYYKLVKLILKIIVSTLLIALVRSERMPISLSIRAELAC